MPAHTSTEYRVANEQGRDKRIWWQRNTIPGRSKLPIDKVEEWEDKLHADSNRKMRFHSPRPRKTGNGKKVGGPYDLHSLHRRMDNRYYTKKMCSKDADYVLQPKTAKVKCLQSITFGPLCISNMTNSEIKINYNGKCLLQMKPVSFIFDSKFVLIEQRRNLYIYFSEWKMIKCWFTQPFDISILNDVKNISSKNVLRIVYYTNFTELTFYNFIALKKEKEKTNALTKNNTKSIPENKINSRKQTFQLGSCSTLDCNR